MKRHAFSGSLLCGAAFAATMTSIYAPLAAASASQQNVLQLPGMTVRAESTPITIIVLLTVLTLLPAILLSMTPFVRILIIFHFLRQALGTADRTYKPNSHRPLAFSHLFPDAARHGRRAEGSHSAL
jgi:flagellar biosynthesis protein FliP